MTNFETNPKKLDWKFNIRSLGFGFGTGPEADWKIIFIATSVLALLIIALSIFMFIKIDKREIFVSDKSSEPSQRTLDTARLKETILYYQNKALEFERIKNSATLITTPRSNN